MKKILICMLCLIFMSCAAYAGSLDDLFNSIQELPDPKAVLQTGATLYDENFRLDDGAYGVAYAYRMPEAWDAFLREYTALCSDAGYVVEQSVQLRQTAWQVTGGGKSAWLIPDYKGCLLVVADKDIPFVPIPTPTPTATPRPTNTPGPTVAPTQVPKGHWEYVTVQQDCFACVNGVCDLCNGSGWYRAYGEKVPCKTYCTTCDGVGWWTTTKMVWVYD